MTLREYIYGSNNLVPRLPSEREHRSYSSNHELHMDDILDNEAVSDANTQCPNTPKSLRLLIYHALHWL